MSKKIIVFVVLTACLSACITDNYIRNISYEGIITDIYQDKNNRNVFTFVIKTKNAGNLVEVAEFFSYSWEYAKVNDSIIKKKGDMYFTIKKKDGDSKIFYFDP